MKDPQQEKQSWILSYYPAFNGLRAVAILSVFYCHYGQIASPKLYSGISWAGVDLFFVLSGFLITGILYDSRQHRKYFNNFYVRRGLRILPVYWGVFTAVIVLSPIFHPQFGRIFFINFTFLQNLLTPSLFTHHATRRLRTQHSSPCRSDAAASTSRSVTCGAFALKSNFT